MLERVIEDLGPVQQHEVRLSFGQPTVMQLLLQECEVIKDELLSIKPASIDDKHFLMRYAELKAQLAQLQDIIRFCETCYEHLQTQET